MRSSVLSSTTPQKTRTLVGANNSCSGFGRGHMGAPGTGTQLSLARRLNSFRALSRVQRASRFEILRPLDQSFARAVQRPALSSPAPPSKMSRSTILLLIYVRTHVSASKPHEEEDLTNLGPSSEISFTPSSFMHVTISSCKTARKT